VDLHPPPLSMLVWQGMAWMSLLLVRSKQPGREGGTFSCFFQGPSSLSMPLVTSSLNKHLHPPSKILRSSPPSSVFCFRSLKSSFLRTEKDGRPPFSKDGSSLPFGAEIYDLCGDERFQIFLPAEGVVPPFLPSDGFFPFLFPFGKLSFFAR